MPIPNGCDLFRARVGARVAGQSGAGAGLRAHRRPIGLLAGAAALAWALAGCAFNAAPPDGFAQFPRLRIFGEPLRASSPDGVLFTVRTEKNDPPADLGFWREALKTRMGHAGYRVVAYTLCPMVGSQGA